MKEKICRASALIVFILSLIIAITVSIEVLLEFLFVFHKKVLIIMGILFIGKELWDFIKKYIRGIFDKFNLLWSFVFFILLFANMAVFEMVVGPKLSKIEISYPKDGAVTASPVIDVEISVRSIKHHLYIIVKTPQRALWRQRDILKTEKFKDTLKGTTQLGELTLGIGETFEIFAIATKEYLPSGILDRVPPDAIWSNTVRVRRVG